MFGVLARQAVYLDTDDSWLLPFKISIVDLFLRILISNAVAKL